MTPKTANRIKPDKVPLFAEHTTIPKDFRNAPRNVAARDNLARLTTDRLTTHVKRS
jgi:hypothetical protein